MSNTIVRIALVNMLLAGIYVAIITLQLGSVSPAAMVLGGLALLINAFFLMRSRPKNGSVHKAGTTDASTVSGTAPMGRTISAAEAAKLPQPRKQKAAEPHELPPWLRVKDNIVMTWEGKHHVAPINGEDPFKAAQRLHVRLLAALQAKEAKQVDKPAVRTTGS